MDYSAFGQIEFSVMRRSLIKSNRSHVVRNLWTQTLRSPYVCRCGTSSHSFSMEKMEWEKIKWREIKTDQLRFAFACNFFFSQMQGLMALALASIAPPILFSMPYISIMNIEYERCEGIVSNNSARVSLQHNNTSRFAFFSLKLRLHMRAILTHSILFGIVAAAAAATHIQHDCLAKRNASQSPSNTIIIIKFSIMNQFGSPLLHWKEEL